MQRLRSTTSTASPFSGVPSVDDRASAALGEEAELAADAESGQEQNRVPFTRLAEEERQVHGKPGFGNGPRETDELRRHTRKFVHQEPRALAIDAMRDAARGELRDGEIVKGCHRVDNILRSSRSKALRNSGSLLLPIW